MASPAHASASSLPLVVRVRRIAFWVLGIDFAALGALGVWLAFRYDPHRAGTSSLHAGLGVVAVVAALVAAVATVADEDRPVSALLPAIVLLGIVAGMFLTGPTLGWDTLAVDGPVPSQRGIAVVFDKDVGAVTRGNDQMTAQTYRRYAWLHALALPVAVLAIGGSGMWAARRRRSYVPTRAAVPDVERS